MSKFMYWITSPAERVKLFTVIALWVLIFLSLISVAKGHDLASWYGPGFHGNKTASGELYDQNATTCAHKTLPFGTIVEVVNLNNGKAVFCRVNDRGPYIKHRVIDVSRNVAQQLGMIPEGVVPVTIRAVRD